MRVRDRPQPATTITLHFRQKVKHPVLWRTRGNVLAVAGLKSKTAKAWDKWYTIIILYEDWSERETQWPKTAWDFLLFVFFLGGVGPTENIPDNFPSSLRLRLYFIYIYIYVCTANFSSHSSRLLQNRSISHHWEIAFFFSFFNEQC